MAVYEESVPASGLVEGHGGDHAVRIARAHGVRTMFTLSGAHVFPLYDAAVGGGPGPDASAPREPLLRLIDVRHEQTAIFAAEATGRLTRTPGFAVVTAGPGVTNGISAMTQAHRAGSPVVVLGGRAATERWGQGSLQELDHPAVLGPVTKRAWTIPTIDDVPGGVDEAFALAGAAHRGPVFVDVPMDQLYRRTTAELGTAPPPRTREVDPDVLADVAAQLATAERPLVILGSDVWLDHAEVEARELVEVLGVPALTHGMARGIVPAGHPLLVGRGRRAALRRCDLVVVIGTPLDFRLNYGRFGPSDGPPARVIHIVDAPDQRSPHAGVETAVVGSLGPALRGLQDAWEQVLRRPRWTSWAQEVAAAAAAAEEQDTALLTSAADPIHPARVYGELLPLLAEDAVVIGDGGDFVSYAGMFVRPRRPGCWLDAGPFGCLGGGVGAALAARIARPEAQVVALLGDGASGLSLLDVDTLVRHRLPVVLVVGNNACWGLERHSMRMLYGYDVAAELGPATAYDRVVAALGGAGETVRTPDRLRPAFERAFASGVPYLVNVLLDPEIGYPRATYGV